MFGYCKNLHYTIYEKCKILEEINNVIAIKYDEKL